MRHQKGRQRSTNATSISPKEVKRPIAGGIVPDSELKYSPSSVNLVSCPTVDGIVPPSREFPYIDSSAAYDSDVKRVRERCR